MAPGPRAQTPPGPPDALDSMLSSLLAGGGCAAAGSVASAEELDALLGEMGADAELWHEPTLFGSLAPGLQCSEACKRPGQRCLDPAHLPNCTSCLAAPCEADVGMYELVGEVGKKNGEKQLRTLVARTREWNSAEVRKSTADECATLTGYEDLAAILRSKRCVLLRKVHLLYLSRVWNYRSDKWARRGDRVRRPSSTAVAAAAAAAAAAASPDACPLAVSAPVQPEAVMTYVAKTLRPLALESAHLAAGGRACEAARSCSAGEAAYLTADTLCELRSVQGHFSAAQSAAAGVHAALCDEAHALSQDEAVQPAWSCLSSDAQAAESLVQGLVQLCSALASDTQRRGASPRLSTCQAVWLDELWQCQLLASECAARAHLVLLRIKTQPRAPFLQGAAVIMEALLNFLSSSRAHLARREAWVSRLIASRPAVGDSSPSALTRAAVTKPVAPPALAELSPVLYAVVGAYAGSGSPAAVCGAVHGGPIKPESSADVPGGGAILAAVTARDGSCA